MDDDHHRYVVPLRCLSIIHSKPRGIEVSKHDAKSRSLRKIRTSSTALSFDFAGKGKRSEGGKYRWKQWNCFSRLGWVCTSTMYMANDPPHHGFVCFDFYSTGTVIECCNRNIELDGLSLWCMDVCSLSVVVLKAMHDRRNYRILISSSMWHTAGSLSKALYFYHSVSGLQLPWVSRCNRISRISC